MKKYSALLFFLITHFLSYGQSDTLKPDIVFDRNYKTDFPSTIDTSFLPKPVGYLNDFEHIFTSDENKFLDSILVAYEQESSNEIAVITVDSSYTSPELLYDYSLAICYKWGLGKRQLDNGILICVSKSMRRIQIQNGYGISPVLNDIETKRIIDEEIIPYFRDGKFFEGLVHGVNVIKSKLKQ
jgi:uncharacterized protein